MKYTFGQNIVPPWGLLKSHFNHKVRQGLRKERKDKTLILNSLRTLRKTFATFAVNGF